MKIYPAVDIKEGKCVRLRQGAAADKTVYFENPVDAAILFKNAGSEWIHVVDLDGAFDGKPTCLGSLKDIASLGMKVQIGGGMRNMQTVEDALNAGASRVIIGTRACNDPAFAEELVKNFGDKIAIGIDAKNGKVAVKGWVEVSKVDALNLGKQMASMGVKTIIYTDIETDGMLTGANIPAQKTMLESVATYGCNIIASGGVGNITDIEKLHTLASQFPNLDGAIVGKAIYENKISLSELFAK